MGSIGGINLCRNGHIFVFAGDPAHGISEGYPCSCGMNKAHWETCPNCGHKELKAIPRESAINTR